jgi:lysophospholipase L1-like esterase
VNRILLPVVAAQGLWMRATIKMAAPATGPTEGRVGDTAGSPLRIGVLGESTAAGCGVDTHEEGFPGCLAREFVARTGRPVTWEVVGQFGATSRRIRHRLLPELGGELDLAVLLAGGNDVLARRTPGEWRDDLTAIVSGLADRAEHVVVSGIPPFARFSSWPATLARYLGERAATLDEISRQVCAERQRTTWIDTSAPPADFLARDRFHPSAAGYRGWAEAVADQLAIVG